MREGAEREFADKMTKSIIITKRQGQVLNRSDIHRWVDSMLDTMPNGVRLLSLRKQERSRSLSQLRLMWLWLTCIEEETGTDKQDVHDYYCKKFLCRNVEIGGKTELVVTGTSGLNTETMTYFLNKVQADAASELGIRLPSPDDEAWEAFEEYYKSR